MLPEGFNHVVQQDCLNIGRPIRRGMRTIFFGARVCTLSASGDQVRILSRANLSAKGCAITARREIHTTF